jgi:hypothetical protein
MDSYQLKRLNFVYISLVALSLSLSLFIRNAIAAGLLCAQGFFYTSRFGHDLELTRRKFNSDINIKK